MGKTIQISLQLSFVCITVFCSCLAEEKFEHYKVGRTLNESVCYGLKLAHANQSIVLTSDGGTIDPACSLGLVGLKGRESMIEFLPVCYTLEHVHIPCGMNNSISGHARKLTSRYDENGTFVGLWLMENSTLEENIFDCHNVNEFTFCETAFMLEVKLRLVTIHDAVPVSVTIRVSKYIPDEQHSIIGPVETPDIEMVSFYSSSGSITIEGDDCPQCAQPIILKVPSDVHDTATVTNDKAIDIDINNIITIVGGIVSSLFIPLILLLIRNYVRNNQTVQRTVHRKPADGSDSVDGKNGICSKNDDDSDKANEDDGDDDDDDVGGGPNLLSSPRNSMFSDDGSFHSAISKV